MHRHTLFTIHGGTYTYTYYIYICVDVHSHSHYCAVRIFQHTPHTCNEHIGKIIVKCNYHQLILSLSLTAVTSALLFTDGSYTKNTRAHTHQFTPVLVAIPPPPPIFQKPQKGMTDDGSRSGQMDAHLTLMCDTNTAPVRWRGACVNNTGGGGTRHHPSPLLSQTRIVTAGHMICHHAVYHSQEIHTTRTSFTNTSSSRGLCVSDFEPNTSSLGRV